MMGELVTCVPGPMFIQESPNHISVIPIYQVYPAFYFQNLNSRISRTHISKKTKKYICAFS